MEKTKKITLTAVAIALVFLVTRFIQIPIPLGYFNIGNCVILLICEMLFPSAGILAGGLGSALADLTSYPVYTLPTLVIKTLMPWVYFAILRSAVGKRRFGRLLAAAVCTLIPLLGYTLTGMVIAGSVAAGVAQFPGLLMEYVANLVFFEVLFVFVAQNAALKRALKS